MKTREQFLSLSKDELIEYILKKESDFELLDAKFRKLQEDYNNTLKKMNNVIEQNKIQIIRAYTPKTETKLNEKTEYFNEAEKSNNKIGRKKGSKNFDVDYLESHVNETIIIEPENYKNISDDNNVIELSPDISYKVKYIPRTITVTKIITKKYFDKVNKQFYQKIKDDPYPHSICTSDLAVNSMINKFMYGIPYYRQSEVMISDGLKISRQNLCNYQIRSTEILKPLYLFLKNKLLQTKTKVIYADETTLRVIENGKVNSYVWVYISSYYDYPIYIYEYCKTRAKSNVSYFLNDFKGYLITDKYIGYDKLEGITNCYCWAHARRKFAEIVKTLNKEQIKNSQAMRIIELIDKLFVKEKTFKEKNLKALDIKANRNTKNYLKDLDSIFAKLKSIKVQKDSQLDKAIKYMLNSEREFKNYISDGHIEMTNNISERAIKPFVIDRKNFLFSNTQNGAESSLIFFSLQQTARANGLNPIEYIKYVIDNIGSNPSDEKLESLLPWNFKNRFSLSK